MSREVKKMALIALEPALWKLPLARMFSDPKECRFLIRRGAELLDPAGANMRQDSKGN
jgi:hypothetical protein